MQNIGFNSNLKKVDKSEFDPERKLTIEGQVGFPTNLYFSIVDYLSKRGYTVKKVKDWLEINPRSPHHTELMRRRGALEQSIGRLLPSISDMRKEIELIKHDLRRLEEVEKHFEEEDEHVLKSDFVDLVDRNLPEHLSLIGLAVSGRFPTIVVDFYKVDSEEAIKDLDIPQTEKSILKKKLRLYNYWKERYGKEMSQKVEMLKSERRSRKASLKNYKESLKPYLKAIYRFRSGESEYTGLDDPALVEGYLTSVAGVKLACWRGITTELKHEYLTEEPEKKYPFYSYIEIEFKKYRLTVREKEKVKMDIEINASLKNRGEIEEEEEEIKEREKELWRELKAFRGEEELEEKEEEETEETAFGRIFGKIKVGLRALTGRRKEFWLPEGAEAPLKEIVEEETQDLYTFIKDRVGGLKRWEQV